MIRRHEDPVAFKAGLLSLLVHALLFVLLFIGFDWKTVPPRQVAQVELWDALPQPKPEPKPVPKPEPKPLPPPEPPKPEPPKPEPKPDIVVKPTPEPPKPKPKPEPPKPDPKIKAKEEAKKREEELKRLQQMLAAEETQALQDKQRREAQQVQHARDAQTTAQMQGQVDEWLGKINNKIRRNVNNQVCGNGKPELLFRIALMPTGQLLSPPKLEKGSGIPACDQAVERAILASEPLPVPSEPELFERFRNLKLSFRPNE